MDINSKLDFQLIGLEQEDTVHLLLELAAPEMAAARRRDPAHLQVVLDRSGSMADGRLAHALKAIESLISRLAPEDRFGLVAFDDQVEVPVPNAEIGDGSQARAALSAVFPRGMTNLASGLVRGFQEASRGSDGAGSTLVLLSDGHANQGVTVESALEDFAAGARRSGVSTSTIGIGLGYDEDLLTAISRGGSGNAHFAEHGDDAGAHLASEVDGLLEQVIQAASLTVRLGAGVAAARLYNDLAVSGIEGGFMAELGDLTSGETRRLLLEIDVPALPELGLAEVATLELRWVDLETMEARLATLPVNVNVVPGDQAAGRISDPEVETELSFQRAQRSKREATDALRNGELGKATSLFRTAVTDLRRSADREGLPSAAASELISEADALEGLAERARSDAGWATKVARADHHMKARKRGRGRDGGPGNRA